jgi:hypothetical protein
MWQTFRKMRAGNTNLLMARQDRVLRKIIVRTLFPLPPPPGVRKSLGFSFAYPQSQGRSSASAHHTIPARQGDKL